ncbi:GNAT family acetyltransferase [Methylobacterium frigidaeris]|uniref:Acetyltransferase YpeA n=1 Tax=Methylobacterium frigidaeris TaxID=2038277 RepID=A0AA37HBC1_9HYPH|nr:GNAT family acetyltransferase [Methylobacterium frigidaeris]PIK72129.1 GNAT family acetyltransferase [Methylobacterium frigidaeris]GJD62765.1 Acetyltransferase YpeA [Methylobacterium frigidaeris]
MTPTIREIEDADVPAVIALWHAAGVARPWNDPATDIAFARRGEHGTVLVAEVEGRVLASAMAGEDGHRGWLYYVAVAPEQQSSGLGRRMVEAAEAWLASRGVWKVQLLVRRENAGVLGFYDHLGYRDTNSVCLQKVIAET